MSEECSHECSACGSDCGERTQEKTDFREAPHAMSQIKKVIGVVSGKGGVGKSLVTSMLAVTARRRGYGTGIMDADITGPSIPKAFGLEGRASGSEIGLFPVRSKTGLGVMSLNLLLDDVTDPVVWRGPMIAGMVKQFWTDVIWEDADFLFIDMPPGTGDVPLTVFQTIPVDGLIIVTSPQELVSMIVEKAVRMANLMHIPILGIVENMSYIKCPDCDKKIPVFGASHLEEIAEKYQIPTMAALPLDPKIAEACDRGDIESFEGNWLDGMMDMLEKR